MAAALCGAWLAGKQAKRRGENPEPAMARMREVSDHIKALDAEVIYKADDDALLQVETEPPREDRSP